MPDSARFAQVQQKFHVGSGDPDQSSPTYAADRKRAYAYRSWAVESYAADLGLCIISRAILAGILAWQYRFRLPWHVLQNHPISRLSSWTGRSVGSCRRYRAKLVASGLLIHQRGAKGRAAGYQVVIPALVMAMEGQQTADGTMATPFSTGYPHLPQSSTCTHMARPVACSSKDKKNRATGRAICAQGDSPGEWYGMADRMALYGEIHAFTASTANLRWDSALQQPLVQAIDAAIEAGHDRDWLRRAVGRACENALTPPKSLSWFVPALHGMVEKGIPDPRVSRAQRETFGLAWKVAQTKTADGVPTFRTIVTEMQAVGIYEFFLSEDAEALIVAFSDRGAPDAGTADYNRRSWRKELARLRIRHEAGESPYPPPRRPAPPEPVEEASPREVGAALVGSGSAFLRAMGERIAMNTGEADAVAAENTRRDDVRAQARALFVDEVEAAKHSPRVPEPELLSRADIQAEIDAVVAARQGSEPCGA